MVTTSTPHSDKGFRRVGALLRRCPSLIPGLGQRSYQINLVSRDSSVEEHVKSATRSLAEAVGFEGHEPFSLNACDATTGAVLMEFTYAGARSPSGSPVRPRADSAREEDAGSGQHADRRRRLPRRRRPFRTIVRRIVIAYAVFYVFMVLTHLSSSGCGHR